MHKYSWPHAVVLQLTFTVLPMMFAQEPVPAIKTITGTITDVGHSRAGINVTMHGTDGLDYMFGADEGKLIGATVDSLAIGDELRVELSHVTKNYPPTYGNPIVTIMIRRGDQRMHTRQTEAKSIGLMVVRTVATVLFIPLTLFIGAGVYQSWIRPSRSRLFFSYSHKDSEIAQRIMRHLGPYHFRTWVDLGKTFPPSKLEEELKSAVKVAEIAIVLCSANSVSSQWVQFEIDHAMTKGKGGFRDFIILALDDTGEELREALKKSGDQLKRESLWSSFMSVDERELLAGDNLSLKDKVGGKLLITGLKNAQRYGDRNRYFARIYGQEVTLFDLRERFDDVLQKVADHLKSITMLHAGGFLRSWRIVVVAVWTVTALGFISMWLQ